MAHDVRVFMLCAESIRDVTDGSVRKLQDVLKSCIENLDLQKIVKDIWQKAIDIDTWIKLDEPADAQLQAEGLGTGRVARYRLRFRRIIGLTFQVSDQYPDLCVLFVWLFVIYMLGVAVLIAILQGWDDSW